MTVHLLRMAVGIQTLDELRARQAERTVRRDGRPVVHGFTRRKPKRVADLTDGGSIYWIVKGAVRARQAIIALDDAVDESGQPFCRLVYDPSLVDTVPQPRRPMQGWRYLAPAEAPPDASRPAKGDDALPPDLVRKLSDMGVL
jgi:hypothetical protein